MMLTGCYNNSSSHEAYSKTLAAYLPSASYAFLGDNHYYHQVDMIKSTEENNILNVVLSGEVLNIEIGESNKDYNFEQHIEIVGDSYWLTNIGETLNESDYSRVCVLKTPITLGQTWEFKTVRDQSIRVKVTAEIIDMASDEVTVVYKDNKGYSERRVLKKEYGITDFYKVYQFEEASAITGFSINLNYDKPADSEDEQQLRYDAMKRIKIPSDINLLLLSYNKAWELYINDGDTAIFEYVEPSTKAFEKIQKIGDDGYKSEIDFISFKPLEYNEDLDQGEVSITIVEAFYKENQMLLTHMNYNLKKYDDKWLITNFEAMIQE
jgi:hypothetical protein